MKNKRDSNSFVPTGERINILEHGLKELTFCCILVIVLLCILATVHTARFRDIEKTVSSIEVPSDQKYDDLLVINELDRQAELVLYYEQETLRVESDIWELAIDIYLSYRQAIWESGNYTKEQMVIETIKFSEMYERPSIDTINMMVDGMLTKHPEIRLDEIVSMKKQIERLEKDFDEYRHSYNDHYSIYQALLERYKEEIKRTGYVSIIPDKVEY